MTTKTKATRKPAAKKLTAAQADKIVGSHGTAKGTKHVVRAADGRTLTFPTERWMGELRELAKIGGSFKAVEKRWAELSTAKLAKGVDAKNSPHTAKAIADRKAVASKSAPAKAKKPTLKQKAQAKAKQQNETLMKSAIKLTQKGKDQIKAGKDNGATANVIRLSKVRTVAKALEAGLKMADINYAKKVGTITVG